MSQTDLAKVSGIAQAQVSRYERGANNPRPQVVHKLTAALGLESLSHTALPPPVRTYDLAAVPTADLLAELGRRCER